MSYRRGWVALMLFSLALINYIDRVALSFAITPVAREFGLSTVGKGYLFSSFLWTYTLFLIPMGLLVDRFGAKRTFLITSVAACSSAWLFAIFANGFLSALLLFSLTGLCSGGSYTPGLTLISERFSPTSSVAESCACSCALTSRLSLPTFRSSMRSPA